MNTLMSFFTVKPKNAWFDWYIQKNIIFI
jgi:hypothetical protein